MTADDKRADISLEESREIMAMAADIRPDENVHHDPALAPGKVARGRPVTAEESARIMALAADVRPLENVHPDEGTDAVDE